MALALKVNKKRAQRVMRLFGIKAYRRRGRRFRRARVTLTKRYPNLLLGVFPGFLREIEWRFSSPETFTSPLALSEILLRPVPTRV